MQLFEIRLELAINPDFPKGNSDCGYIWKLPLTDDFRIDSNAWEQQSDSFQVTRFWMHEDKIQGRLMQRAKGTWYLEFTNGANEPVFQLEEETLLPGQFIDIRDHGDQMHIFKEASIASVEAVQPNIEPDYRSNKTSKSEATYYNVELAIENSDPESFLGSSYTLHLALNDKGMVDLGEWERNSVKWQATSKDPSGEARTGELLASQHVWYLHFREPDEIYELIKQMEKQVFLGTDAKRTYVQIRDRSGHWHSFTVSSCTEA